MRIMKGRVARWGAGAVGLVLMACPNPLPPPPPPPPTPGQPVGRLECPRFWPQFNTYNARGGIVGSIPGPLPLSDSLTDIPEFNDCQRFIVPDTGGTERYDSLYAIFVSKDIRTARFPATGGGRAIVERGMPVATIYSIGGTYSRLGIQPGLNCLYLSTTDPQGSAPPEYQAAIVAVSDGDCEERPYDGNSITTLDVVRTSPSSLVDDYPVAARWVTDNSGMRYAAGIPCGAGWCEVGRYPTTLSPAYNVPGAQAKQFAIKGWYDEQRLAIQVPSVGGNKVTIPSPIVGTVVPDASLGRYTKDDFRGRWLPVVYVFLRPAATATSVSYVQAFSAYTRKFGFVGQNSSIASQWQGNRIESCLNDTGQCELSPPGVPADLRQWIIPPPPPGVQLDTMNWLVRIISMDGDTVYRHVTRCPHEEVQRQYHFGVAATARWHWLADDGTVWYRCDEGCCEVHPWLQ